MDYSIDYDSLIKKVKNSKAKNVLLQFPDGIKPDFKKIVDKLSSKCKCDFFTWGGTCFGACDIPVHTKMSGIDLIVHFGHERFL